MHNGCSPQSNLSVVASGENKYGVSQHHSSTGEVIAATNISRIEVGASDVGKTSWSNYEINLRTQLGLRNEKGVQNIFWTMGIRTRSFSAFSCLVYLAPGTSPAVLLASASLTTAHPWLFQLQVSFSFPLPWAFVVSAAQHDKLNESNWQLLNFTTNNQQASSIEANEKHLNLKK